MLSIYQERQLLQDRQRKSRHVTTTRLHGRVESHRQRLQVPASTVSYVCPNRVPAPMLRPSLATSSNHNLQTNPQMSILARSVCHFPSPTKPTSSFFQSRLPRRSNQFNCQTRPMSIRFASCSWMRMTNLLQRRNQTVLRFKSRPL